MGRKYDPSMKDLLLAADRAQRLDPVKMLRALKVKAGMTVADLGCGPGFFTLPAAELVGPGGQVYAVDVQQPMVDALRTRLGEQHIQNVIVRRSSELEPGIPPESVDLALIAFVLQEVEQRSRFLLAAKRLLKPGGRIAVLNWEKVQTPVGPPLEVRVTSDETIADAHAAGLKLVEEQRPHPYHYVLVFAPR